MKKGIIIISFLVAFFGIHCSKGKNQALIDRVVIIVIDGPRNSDINEDSLSEYNGGYKLLKNQGLYFSNFMNQGTTNTQNGMSNIITGNEEILINNGSEVSSYASIFHHYLKNKNISPDKTWIISSKDKLETLKSTKDTGYNLSQIPRTNCGKNGLGTGYRADSMTCYSALDIFQTYQPSLAFITFREPDYSGHAGKWQDYKMGMKNAIAYTQKLIDFVQTDANYQGRTLVLITNDHGRHLDGIADGFLSHGDSCIGCRHITLLTISPNISPGSSVASLFSLNNIAPTIARILNFEMPSASAESILEIF
jgi:hypothetical protein